MIKVIFELNKIHKYNISDISDNKEVPIIAMKNFIIANIVSKFKEKMAYKDMLICDNIDTEGINNASGDTPQALSHTFLLNDSMTYNHIFKTIKDSYTEDLRKTTIKELKSYAFSLVVRIETSYISGSYTVKFKSIDDSKMNVKVECKPWDTKYPNVLMPQYIDITGSDM